jgi:hypothetical protein
MFYSTVGMDLGISGGCRFCSVGINGDGSEFLDGISF